MALVISGNIVEYLRKKRELKNLIPTKILRLNSEIRKIMKIVFFIAIAMSVEWTNEEEIIGIFLPF